MVLSGEEGLALEHLSENTSRTPDVNLDVVFLPCEHNLGSSVISGGDVSRHLGVLYTGETEIADFEIAVLIHEDVAGLQVTMYDTSGVDVFQSTLSESAVVLELGNFATHQNLVEKVLDELLLQRSGGEQAMEIGSEELGDEVTGGVSMY